MEREDWYGSKAVIMGHKDPTAFWMLIETRLSGNSSICALIDTRDNKYYRVDSMTRSSDGERIRATITHTMDEAFCESIRMAIAIETKDG
jgi:hypothetical protein